MRDTMTRGQAWLAAGLVAAILVVVCGPILARLI